MSLVVLGFVIFLLFWYLGSLLIGKYLPPPHVVFPTITENLYESRYFESIGLPPGGYAPHLWSTFVTVLIGVSLGYVAGCITGFASAMSRVVFQMLAPVAWVLGAAPIMVVAPFFLIWFGVSEASKIILVALYTALTMHLYALRSITLLAPAYLEYARTLGVSNGVILRRVLIPSSLPARIGGLRIALAAAWGLAAVTELLGSSSGIGRVIIATWGVYDLGAMMGAIVLIGIVAVLCDAVVVAERRHLLRWMDRGDK